MTAIEKYLTGAFVVLALLGIATIGGYFYGRQAEKNVYAAAALKQEKLDAKKVAAVNVVNSALAAKNGALQQQIQALRHRIASQPAKERIVYVHVKSSPAPVAITGPVYVTADAVSLFNSSFGLPDIPGTSAGTDEGAGAIPSPVTVSDYERQTTENATACYQNQQTLSQLQAYIRSLETQGAIK